MHRRSFVAGAAAAAALSLAKPSKAAPNDRVAVCVMGVRGRGGSLLSAFASLPDVEVKYVCDLDSATLAARIAQVADRAGRKPTALADYRKALEDPSLDALVIGTPDHWHALPTIHACQAGKDVYVEKPDGHNILEGRTMIAAARKHGRIVQLGTQARSGEHHNEAMSFLAKGGIGKVRFAKAWESARQGSIGLTPNSQPPAGFDYDFWLGPAPKRPFNSRRFHGSWRWFFDYGTGDLGNDGVHRLDLARWALDSARKGHGEPPLGTPKAVSAHGGKHYFDDDQQWPDNLLVTYDYGDCLLTYEMRIWSPYRFEDEAEGALVYGDGGYVVIGNSRWRAFDAKGKLMSEKSGGDATSTHARNFLDCMRTRQKPAADLETVGHPSSLLCHLGNAAWRAGRTLRYDGEQGRFLDDEPANQFLTRPEYRKPWVLPKVEEV